jgi:hypothetical protein
MATTELSFKLGRSQRDWLILRGSSVNPFDATGGPLPQVTVPLEARITERDIELEILRLAFDLKNGNTLLGQGEIGPCMYLATRENYLAATAALPQAALSRLVNPSPPQGRIVLTLAFRGLLRYRHSYQLDAGQTNELGEPGTWHIQPIGGGTLMELDVQVARSDWYEQVVAKLGLGGYIVTPLYLPYGSRPGNPRLGTWTRPCERS